MICRSYGNANERTGQRIIIAWNWKGEEQKHPRLMKKKDFRARRSIAGTVEPDMAQVSVLHTLL